ncbi:Serine/threonine-protein kinase PknB [Alloactinosynnema sp. L-07]|nr:Serine/threonine-protein kinase PknB [Alloactinosynnema sp. L-07]
MNRPGDQEGDRSVSNDVDDGVELFDVFVSYAGADRDVVAPFVELLKKGGWKVWFYDAHMSAGPALKPQIASAIRRSAYMIVCLTDSYLASDWTEFELLNGTHADPAGKSGTTIVVKFKPMTGKVPAHAAHLFVYDFSDQRDYDRHFARITNLIKRRKANPVAETYDAPLSAEPVEALYQIWRKTAQLSRELHQQEIGDVPPNAPDEQIIGQLLASQKLPPRVIEALSTARTLGNQAVNSRSGEVTVAADTIAVARAAFDRLMAWRFPEREPPDVWARVYARLPQAHGGRRIPGTDYVLTGAELGRNSHGPLYPGRDTARGTTVSINLVGIPAERDDAFFEQVARFTRLSDPNIVAPMDAGTIAVDGERLCLFLVLPVVDGVSAQTLTEHHGPLPPRAAYELCLGIAKALRGFHAADPPIAHGDIKPANAVVGTFGTVSVLCIGSDLTDSPADDRIDSMLFTHPEQRSGAPATPRSDVQALRLVLHYLLTGDYLQDGTEPDPAVDPHRVLERLVRCVGAASACATIEAACAALPPLPNLASVNRGYRHHIGATLPTPATTVSAEGIVLTGSYPIDAKRAWPLPAGLVLVWEQSTDTLAILDSSGMVWRDSTPIAVRRTDTRADRIAVGGWDGALRFFVDGALAATDTLSGAVGDVRLVGDGVVAGSWRHDLRQFTTDGVRRDLLDVAAGTHRIAVAKDGDRFAVADLSGGLSIYVGERRVATLPDFTMAADIAYAGGRLVVLTDTGLTCLNVDGTIGAVEPKPGASRLIPGHGDTCGLLQANQRTGAIELWRIDEADRHVLECGFPPGAKPVAHGGGHHVLNRADGGRGYWRDGAFQLEWPDAVAASLSADGKHIAVCEPGRVALYEDLG